MWCNSYCIYLLLLLSCRSESAAIKVWLCSGGIPAGLSGFRLDETSEIKAAVGAQTRPSGVLGESGITTWD